MKSLSDFSFCFKYIGISLIQLTFICPVILNAQDNITDSIKYDYRKIYSYCLDADIKSALLLVDNNGKNIGQKDSDFKTKLENRFKYPEDNSSFLESKKSSIDELLKIYHSYWRKSLLDNSVNYDSAFINELCGF